MRFFAQTTEARLSPWIALLSTGWHEPCECGDPSRAACVLVHCSLQLALFRGIPSVWFDKHTLKAKGEHTQQEASSAGLHHDRCRKPASIRPPGPAGWSSAGHREPLTFWAGLLLQYEAQSTCTIFTFFVHCFTVSRFEGSGVWLFQLQAATACQVAVACARNRKCHRCLSS